MGPDCAMTARMTQPMGMGGPPPVPPAPRPKRHRAWRFAGATTLALVGAAVIAGHRVTYTHPFRDLGELVPGDQIIVSTADGAFTYAVTETFVVDPSAVWIADQQPGRILTLFTCHPPGSEAFRFVVRSQLLY